MSSYNSERVIVSPLPGNEDILAEAAAHVEVGNDEEVPILGAVEKEIPMTTTPVRLVSGYRPVTVNVVSSSQLRQNTRASHKTVILPVPKMHRQEPVQLMPEESVGEEIVTTERHPDVPTHISGINTTSTYHMTGNNPRVIYVLSGNQQKSEGKPQGKKIRLVPTSGSSVIRAHSSSRLNASEENLAEIHHEKQSMKKPNIDATYAQEQSADPEEAFSCETCGQMFGDNFRELRLHEIRTGHGKLLANRQYKCSICLLNFESGTLLARHYRMAHGRAANCPHCGIRFQRMEDLSLHVLQFHFRTRSAMDEATLTAQAREAEMAMGFIHPRNKKRSRQPRPAFGEAAQPLPVPSPKFEMVQVGSGFFKKELPTDGQLTEYVAKIAQTPTEQSRRRTRRSFPSAARDSEEDEEEDGGQSAQSFTDDEEGSPDSNVKVEESSKETSHESEVTQATLSIQGIEQEDTSDKSIPDVQFCCAACKQNIRSKAQHMDKGIGKTERESAIKEGKHDEMAEYVYECTKEECGVAFRHFAAWRSHIEEHEHDGYTPEIVCETCCAIQYDDVMLQWHVGLEHPDIVDVEKVSPTKKNKLTTPTKSAAEPMVTKSGRKRKLTPKAEKMQETEGFEALLAAAAHLDSAKKDPDDSLSGSGKKRGKYSPRKGGGKQPESKVLTMTRKNAATTKLPGRNNKEDAPSLDDLNPEFLNRIQTVDQKRHFRQAHSEKLLQETLLFILERLKAYSSASAREDTEMDVSDCFVLLDCFQDLWRVFYPDYYNKVLSLVSKVKNTGYEVSYPTISSTIANTYTQAGICKEPIPMTEPVVLFGRFVVNPKRRKARSNFACRKFPGTDYDSPSLDELSSEQIKGLGYDQARRFRRAHGEVFLYEMLRYLHKTSDKQQGVLLKHFWRYWWVFYPTELQLLTSAEALTESEKETSGAPFTGPKPPTATSFGSGRGPRIVSAKVIRPGGETSSVIMKTTTEPYKEEALQTN